MGRKDGKAWGISVTAVPRLTGLQGSSTILPRLFLMADWGEFPNLFLHLKIGVKVREMAW